MLAMVIRAPATKERVPRTYLLPEDRDCERPPVERPTIPTSPPSSGPIAKLALVSSHTADDVRPAYAPAVGEACNHYMAHEVEGRLYCVWCGDLINWP